MADDPTWFRVIAVSEQAKSILNYRENIARLLPITFQDGQLGFNISSTFLSRGGYFESVLTFGKDLDCHVWLGDDEQYSLQQCNFFLNRDSKILLIEDTTLNGNTLYQPLHPNPMSGLLPYGGKSQINVPDHNSEINRRFQMPYHIPRQRIVIEENHALLHFQHWTKPTTFRIEFPGQVGETPVPWWERFISIKEEFIKAPRPRPFQQRPLNQDLSIDYRYVPALLGWEKPYMLEFYNMGKLGQGGFGQVTKEIDMTTGSVVAIKHARADPVARNELYFLLNLRHKHIVKYYGCEFQKLEGLTALRLFMQPADVSLDKVLQGRKRLPIPSPLGRLVIINACSQITSALNFLHSQRIIHRDLKPQNVLVSNIKGVDHYYLCDFGLSKLINLGTSVVGTPMYMAPEVNSGNQLQDISADYWSLGVMIYDMATSVELTALGFGNGTNFRTQAFYTAIIDACASLGDLARLVTRDPRDRMIATHSGFPRMPATLPKLLVPRTSSQAQVAQLHPPAPAPRVPQPMQYPLVQHVPPTPPPQQYRHDQFGLPTAPPLPYPHVQYMPPPPPLTPFPHFQYVQPNPPPPANQILATSPQSQRGKVKGVKRVRKD